MSDALAPDVLDMVRDTLLNLTGPDGWSGNWSDAMVFAAESLKPGPDKPRRRVVAMMKIEADTWDDLRGELKSLATDLAMGGRLSTSSVSGGYSAGHIIATDEAEEITHETWARDLAEYLEGLPK